MSTAKITENELAENPGTKTLYQNQIWVPNFVPEQIFPVQF